LKDWKGKHVVIVGLARQGSALIRSLANHGAHVVVTDMKSSEQLAAELAAVAGLTSAVHLGSHPDSLLDGTDAVFLSGGVPADLPLIRDARRRGIPVLNDSQLFLEQVQAPVTGITGSAGKSTTTSLTGHILRRFAEPLGNRVWVGGNIGNPLITNLEEIRSGDEVVMELSSFQLEIMTRSPHTAALLNVSPNHLDRHGTMENYLAAKANIFAFQAAQDWALIGCDDDRVLALKQGLKGQAAGFGRALAGLDGVCIGETRFIQRWQGRETAICPLEETPLRGEHNLWNVAAAFALCTIRGVPVELMRSALHDFRGLAHRLEEVGRKHGMLWINDSIATTPERAAAALRAFTEPLIVLAGGHDKGLSWKVFSDAADNHARQIILFGEAAPVIEAALAAEGCQPGVQVVGRLEDAVEAALEGARDGSVVLLAPGCSSFDAFRDFEARGEKFKELVAAL